MNNEELESRLGYLNMALDIINRRSKASDDEEFVFRDEHFGTVLRLTNRAETKMKLVIAHYLQVPAHKHTFLESYVLNTAITSFASKVKLVMAIASDLGVKLERNAFHILISRRNALAHQDFANSIRTSRETGGSLKLEMVVESIKGNGEMEVITRDQAFEQLVLAYSSVEEALDELLEKVVP